MGFPIGFELHICSTNLHATFYGIDPHQLTRLSLPYEEISFIKYHRFQREFMLQKQQP